MSYPTVAETTWSHSLRALKPGGVVVCSGSTSGPNPPADLQRLFFRQLRVVESTMGTLDELRDLLSFVETAGITPEVGCACRWSGRRTASGHAAIPNPTATRVVDRLVAQSLAHRRNDPNDRRRVLVHLAAGGREVVEGVSRRLDSALTRLPVSESRVRALVAQLRTRSARPTSVACRKSLRDLRPSRALPLFAAPVV